MKRFTTPILILLAVLLVSGGAWGQPVVVSKAGIPPGTTRADGSAAQDGDSLFRSTALGRWIAGAVAAAGGTWGSITGTPIVPLPYADLTAGQYIGLTSPGVCGETLAVGNAVYIGASGRVWQSVAGVGTTSMPAIGVVAAVVGGGTAGQVCTILTLGYINTGTFTAATSPTYIYVDRATPGLLTITAPATVGDQVEFIGYVTEIANVMRIQPNLALFEVGTGIIDLASEVGSTILPAPNGGTGQTTYAVGDVLYAPTTTTIGKLAAVATGQVMASAGVNTAPVYTATPSVRDLTLTRGVLTLTGTAAPLVPATALVAGGSMTAGGHYAKISYITSDGKESALSPASTPVITTAGGNLSMSVTRNGGDAPPVDIVSWKVYATKIGSAFNFFYVDTVDVADSTYTITMADASFGSAATDLGDQTAGIKIGSIRALYPYYANGLFSGIKNDANFRALGYLDVTGTTNCLQFSSAVLENLVISNYIKYGGASRVSTDFTSADTTTLANITGLTAAVGATRNYRFRVELWVTSTGTPTDKWKVAINNSTAVTSIKYNVEYLLSAAVRNESTLQTAIGAGGAVNCTSSLAYDHIIITGHVATNTAGNLTVQIAKQGTGSDTITVLAGSNCFVDFVN